MLMLSLDRTRRSGRLPVAEHLRPTVPRRLRPDEIRECPRFFLSETEDGRLAYEAATLPFAMVYRMPIAGEA
jgi:hypothetical protein